MCAKRSISTVVSDYSKKAKMANKAFTGEIVENRFLSTTTYKDVEYIHIRDRFVSNGQIHQLKKGISFTTERYAAFRHIIPDIDECIQKRDEGEDIYFRHHIGGGVHVTIQGGFEGVDVRKFFLPKDKPTLQATKTGIFIPFNQWNILKEQMQNMEKQKPYLTTISPCFQRDDHMSQIVAFDCKECNPFGDALRCDPFNFYGVAINKA